MAYQGHASKAAWNVALWIANDEGLYRLALEHIRRAKTRNEAAENMLADLAACGVTQTPDGHKYSKSTIRAAMVDLS